MKSIFKNKALIALKLMLLLSLSTKGQAVESGGIPQTSSGGGTFIVDGGFKEPDRKMLTAAASTIEEIDDKVKGVPQVVTYLGQPTDLITVPRNPSNSVFGVINRFIEMAGTQPTTGLITFFQLLVAINGAVNPNGGNTVSVDLGEMLKRIGVAIPTGSNLFTEIAAIKRLIGPVPSPTPGSLYQTIIDGDTAILKAIHGIVGPSGTSITQLFNMLQLNGRKLGILNEGILFLMNQLCVRHGGEQYLPKALVELNRKVDGISRCLGHHHHHSGGGSAVLHSDDGERIIELIGGEDDNTSVTDKLKILASSVTNKFEALGRAALHTHREVRQIKADTVVLGQFEDPEITVAGSLEAIVKAFGNVATYRHVELLTKGVVELNQRVDRIEGKMDRLIALLMRPSAHHRHHHDSDDSSHP